MRTLPLLDELEAALTSGSIPRRVDILSRVTDLFVTQRRELFRRADRRVRRCHGAAGQHHREPRPAPNWPQRLAPIANAPSNVIHMLAFDDDIDVAGSVLTLSDRLDERDLLISAGTKSQKHLLAISQRRTLSESVTNVLVERGDHDVIHSVVRNTGARFSDAGFRMLVNRSADDDGLATDVGLRRRYSPRAFPAVARKSLDQVRARLSAEHPQAKTTIEGVVAEVVSGIREETRYASPDFAAAQDAVERQNRLRRIGEADVYEYARDRKFEETAIALSIMCDTPIDVVERALLDPGAEIILILAKVADLSPSTTKAILLLRAADRGMSAKDLDQALNEFQQVAAPTLRGACSASSAPASKSRCRPRRRTP